jgi:hypothetical protein
MILGWPNLEAGKSYGGGFDKLRGGGAPGSGLGLMKPGITLTEMEDEDEAPMPGIGGDLAPLAKPGGAWETRDYTFWAKTRLAELVRDGGKDCTHCWRGLADTAHHIIQRILDPP